MFYCDYTLNYFSVAGRPVITPNNQTITAVYNQPLSLSMEFCANPPYNKVFWIAKDEVIRPGDASDKIIAHTITVSIVTESMA